MKDSYFRTPRTLRDAEIDGSMAGIEGPYTWEAPLLTRRTLWWAALVAVSLLPLVYVLGAR